ncbi:ComEA family DNA-binding protein [Shewanella pneumatophori]|uniref:Helix-hairpin-helix domain-containing protein n=1 Tax=Shewanella pneumatophori TaxID=314092 RepID=A0A9X1ZCP4_9GAMM|nr:ComEA family DNA-binding protein [Shewanella pneumatophori]MCL1139121.1 helix-hairpin-helix domain-containing protein [Shewanella pneumatophori]
MYKHILSVFILLSLLAFSVEAAPKKVDVAPTSESSQLQLVKINSATVTELAALSGVGEAKAQAIVEYRKVHGNFKSIDQLNEVKGIGEKLIEKNRASLSL